MLCDVFGVIRSLCGRFVGLVGVELARTVGGRLGGGDGVWVFVWWLDLESIVNK